MQFDADTVGSASPAADAEMCMMAADTMEALGIPRGSYVVKVNNRKVLDGVMESVGLGGEENAGRRLTALRAIDKLDKFPADQIRNLLCHGRWDGGEEGKGDFTKGAGLEEIFANRLLQFVAPSEPTITHSDDILFAMTEDWELANNPNFKDGGRELLEIRNLCQSSGYAADRIKVDQTIVRGLEYYTGPVFEVELLLETKDEKGRPVRFGSVGGGGRYDGLVSRFRGEPVPATGFSIGVSRLQAALTMLGKIDTTPEFGPVVVTVFDRDRVADYQKMVAVLRNANIRAELYLGNPKNMGNQLKYADRRNSPCVIIQGSDEKTRHEVQIKDLIEGAKAAAAIASNAEWRETRPAQFSCGEGELVEKVREVLARHGVTWG
jgi:histidyl-tRNA synthetase